MFFSGIKMKHFMIYNIYHVRMYMCMHVQFSNNNKSFSSLEGLNIRVNIKQKRSNSQKSFVIFLFQHYYSRDNRDSASQMSVWIQGSRLLLQCLLVINEMNKQRCNSWEMFVRCSDEDKTHKHEFPRFVRENQIEMLHSSSRARKHLVMRDNLFLRAMHLNHFTSL